MSWLVTVRHPSPVVKGICYGRAEVEAEFSSEQVESLLAQLGNVWPGAGPERVSSSPMRRCHRLAVELATRLGRPLDVDDRLCELAFGEWEGRSWRELEREPSFRAWMGNWTRAAPPGGESLPDLHARVGKWLQLTAERGAPVMAVTHAGVIRSLRVHLAGSNWERAFGEPVPYLVPQLWALSAPGPLASVTSPALAR